jgi:hypothetical protein
LIDSILADLMVHEAKLLDGLNPADQADLRRILKLSVPSGLVLALGERTLGLSAWLNP